MNICTETYEAALTWTAEQRDAERMELLAFMAEKVGIISDADYRELGRELRAIRQAGLDAR